MHPFRARLKIRLWVIGCFGSLPRHAIRHPLRTLVLAALVTLATGPGLFRLKLRTDGHALIPPRAPEVQFDQAIRSQFGIHDQLVVLIQPHQTNGIFNPVTLQLVRELSAEFLKIPGVNPADVISLATEPGFRLRPGSLAFQKMLEPPLQTPVELEQLRDDLRRIAMYTGTLVSADSQSTVILVGVPEGADRAQFYETVRTVIGGHENAPDKIAVTGAPVAESLLGVQILEDLGVPKVLLGASIQGQTDWKRPSSVHELRLFAARRLGLVPLAALVMMLVFLLCFRNVLAALLPLPGVAATMIFVFGLMGWCEVPLYLTTAVMPVLLTVLSVTNDIYLFNRYFNLLREKPGHDHKLLVGETFNKLVVPVACTSLTAVVGFLSFGLSPLVPVRAFGLFTGLGALFGLFFSLTVVPALLTVVNPKWLLSRRQHDRRTPLADWFARAGAVVVRRRSWVIGGTLLVLALTPLGLRKLVVQDSWTNGFDPESEFRKVTQQVNEQFFGMHLLFVAVEAPRTLAGEVSVAELTPNDIAFPRTLTPDAAVMMGSPIRLWVTDDPATVWRSHIEMVNSGDEKIFTRIARGNVGANFWPALGTTRSAHFEITARTHLLPEVIRALGDLGDFIRARRDCAVGGVLGPEDYLLTTRFMTRSGDPPARVLPGNGIEVKLLWDYYGLALGQPRLRQLVDTNYARSLTTVFLKDANFVDTARLMGEIRDYERTKLAPLGIKIGFAGDVAVSQALIGGIVTTQLQSLGWSLAGIFLVAALFGGMRWGFFCLLPSLLAILIKFAVMGWSGIPLGVATSMFAAMTLGIGVNCAIHLLESFDQMRVAGGPPLETLARALRLTGPPALINTLAMSLGFGVLMLSQVPANARLGILLVLGLVNCFAASLLLLPVLLAMHRPRDRQR